MEEEQRKEGRRGGDYREGRKEARRDGLREMDFFICVCLYPYYMGQEISNFSWIAYIGEHLTN